MAEVTIYYPGDNGSVANLSNVSDLIVTVKPDESGLANRANITGFSSENDIAFNGMLRDGQIGLVHIIPDNNGGVIQNYWAPVDGSGVEIIIDAQNIPFWGLYLSTALFH